MKKMRFIAVMLMAALLVTFCGGFAYADEDIEVKTTASVNLRKGPGTDYAKITSVKKGREFDYTGISRYDDRGVVWHRIEYKTGYAWVSSRYSNVINDGVALNDSTYVEATASVNLRSGPGTGYKKLSTAAKGDKLFYLGEQAKDAAGRKWYKASCSKGEVWVISTYARIKTGEVSYEQQTYVMTTGSVNLRMGPALGYKKIVAIPDDTKLEYMGKSTKDGRGVVWYNVGYKTNNGWVSSAYAELKK
ncbi:MAG: SH3 domain-containing protein [Clostridia bacterium]|nr:SH3 domain-containing protein [Clostridia bacterium]